MASRIDRFRKICLALPEATEKRTWERPTFRVRDKIFATADDDASAVTVKADPDELPALLGDDRFEKAHYTGRFGWVTMTLQVKVDWTEVDELVRTSYSLIAPKKLARQVLPPAN